MSDTMESVMWLPRPITLTTSLSVRDRLLQAYNYANDRSPDPSTKNGSILIDTDGNVLTFGVNKFPTGVAETNFRLHDKATKYRLVVHAENGAIFNAAKHGKATRDSTLYCPFYACSECAKAIIQAGVKTVIGHAQLMALASEHTTWVESIVDAWNMLHEAGIGCELYDGVVGVTTRFNGSDISV